MNIERALATQGFMAESELTYLAELAAKSKYIAEIGTWQGRSAIAIAENKQKEGVLYCVDTWADNAYGSAPAEMTSSPNWLWNAFQKNIGDLLHNPIFPYRLNSVDGAAHFREEGCSFDMIFIDAGHNYEDVIADIRAWKPLLASGGVLCGHDYAEYHPGVIRAVDELVPKFKVIGTIWTTEGMEEAK